jgi:hypothetical protein
VFGVVDDIFCLFQGTIENIPMLKQQYGLSKGATEINLVIEAYRTLRDRGPYPADQVVRDLSGKFAFVLYDRSTSSVFMAAVSEYYLDSNFAKYLCTQSVGMPVSRNRTRIIIQS